MPFDSEPEGKFERRIFFSARAWWQDIRSALRFLTRLPLPRVPDPAEPDFFDEVEEDEQETPARRPLGRAVRAFPLIGALLGIAAGFAFAIATGVGLPALVAGVIAVALLALMTGALHEDGLADMADGFGGGQSIATLVMNPASSPSIIIGNASHTASTASANSERSATRKSLRT